MKDILLGIDFDLLIEGGDFVVGESTRQHQQLLLVVEKGELREFPLRGVGANTWLNEDSGALNINAEIKREFEADGMKVLQVATVGNTVQTEAYYE